MKTLLFLLLFSSFLWADSLAWRDLSSDQTFFLKQDLRFQKAPDVFYTVPKDIAYQLKEAHPLPGLGVIFYELITEQCPSETASQYAEMMIILPEGSSDQRDHSVGVALDFLCTLEVFVESADLNAPSLFHRPSQVESK